MSSSPEYLTALAALLAAVLPFLTQHLRETPLRAQVRDLQRRVEQLEEWKRS